MQLQLISDGTSQCEVDSQAPIVFSFAPKKFRRNATGPVFATIHGQPLQGYKHWFDPAVEEAGIRGTACATRLQVG
jgi:hypothetical protein